MECPCRYCEHRSVGCHSHCEAYAGYDSERIRMRQERMYELALDSMQVDRFINADRNRKAAYQRLFKKKR